MKILGIETSCDETGAAVIETDEKKPRVRLLSNVFPSSMALHAKTGGIIPEIAAREQVKYIIPVVQSALDNARITSPGEQLDAIAVTYGPGLIGSLLVGVETAKTLSLVWGIPIIPVNHLFGHIYANWIEGDAKTDIAFPALALVISGGHTDLVLLKNHGDTLWLGGTRDDAAGEALDKIGRLLGLPYPGGPSIEEQAKIGNPKRYHFPRPLIHERAFDFSFSGLKTAVLHEVKKNVHLTGQDVADIARATQDAIIDVLVVKTMRAAQTYHVSSIILAGGVASNQEIREKFNYEIEHKKLPITFFVPEKYLCTDNAAMIATAAFYNKSFRSRDTVAANPELYFD